MVLLPYGCEIVFPECDCTDIVFSEILETFIIEIDQRRKRKQEKDPRQERAWIKGDSCYQKNQWAQVKHGKELLADDYESGLPTTMAIGVSTRQNPMAAHQVPPWKRLLDPLALISTGERNLRMLA